MGATRNAKKGKAAGADGIYTEIIKLIEEGNVDLIVKLFYNIYETCQITQEWLQFIYSFP